MNEEELRRIMYGWKLKVVPDPLAYPDSNPEPGFRPLSSYNRHPVRPTQHTDIWKMQLAMGILTKDEVRDLLGLKGP